MTEVSTVANLQNGRNAHLNEPFNIYDPNLPFAGKKRFNDNFRPLRSKINLQIGGEEVQARKKTNKITVKQSFLDEFEKRYQMNCNQNETRKKHRNVSYDSPFDPKNVPPLQHL